MVSVGTYYSICAAASNIGICFINSVDAGALYYREVMVFASGIPAVLALITLVTLMKKDVGGAREGMPISDKSRHSPLDLSFWNYYIFRAEKFFFSRS